MSAPAALSAMGGGGGHGNKKITICHKGKTIKVSKQGWKHGHKKHGDHKGRCNGNGNGGGNGNGNGNGEDCDDNDNGIVSAAEIEYCDDDNGNGGNNNGGD